MWAVGKESKPREYGLLFLGILDPTSSTSLGNLCILVSQGTQDSFLLLWTHTSVALRITAIVMSLSSPQSARVGSGSGPTRDSYLLVNLRFLVFSHTQLETPCWLYELNEGMLGLCLMQFCGFCHQPHSPDERTESRSKVTV